MKIKQPGPVMVCVTRQKACQRLIKHGAQLAAARDMPLTVVHVARNGEDLLGNVDEGAALDFLFGIAKTYGADMVMLRSDDVAKTLCQYASAHNASVVVLGETREGHTAVKGLMRRLNTRIPGLEIEVVVS
ncbi:MAG: universal stress protein [Clostridiales bacterium]|nr:universal stress protein [Clostridiales bacterium]